MTAIQNIPGHISLILRTQGRCRDAIWCSEHRICFHLWAALEEKYSAHSLGIAACRSVSYIYFASSLRRDVNGIVGKILLQAIGAVRSTQHLCLPRRPWSGSQCPQREPQSSLGSPRVSFQHVAPCPSGMPTLPIGRVKDMPAWAEKALLHLQRSGNCH